MTGLSALILGSGCAQKEAVQSQQGVDTNVPLAAVEAARNAVTLNLEVMRSFADFALVIDDEFRYIFTKDAGVYGLTRMAAGQSLPEWVAKLDDPDRTNSVSMDLGDGKTYTLAYNAEADDYQLSH